MKIITLAFLLTCTFTCSSAQISAAFGGPKFAPNDGKKLLIIGQDLGAVGGLKTHSRGYVDNITNHIPAGVTTYTNIASLDGLLKNADWGSGDVYAEKYLEEKTFDHTAISIGLYMVGSLRKINAGKLDLKIVELATWIKRSNRPVFLRIGYEFEGSWNDYNPDEFKKAWQYIVHIFDEVDVKNVSYVWQSAGLNYNNINDWYPGDEFVNWVAFSQFSGGNNMGRKMLTFAEEHDKPLMIAEAAPQKDLMIVEGEALWKEWFAPLFDRIYDNDRIKALAYINVNWDIQAQWQGQGWGDSRVQVNQFIREYWINEITKEPWITASDSLFNSILNHEFWVEGASAIIDHWDLRSYSLIISQVEGRITVQTTDNNLMEEVEIYQVNGKLLHSESGPVGKFTFNTGRYFQGSLVIVAKKEGRRIGKLVYNKQ